VATVRLCTICHERPAEVPDRERMGRPIKRVCRVCHGERLKSDLEKILEDHLKRQRPR
jgi:hypothetical protein